MNKKYYTIIGTVVCIVFIIILFIVFYFESSHINKIVDVTVNNSPIYMENNKRAILSENIKSGIKKTREIVSNSPVYLKNKLEKIIEKSLPDDEIPKSEIKKCVNEEVYVIPEFPQIALPEDMPWDDKIEYCKNNGGNIYEIDMYEKLLNYQPQRVLNF